MAYASTATETMTAPADQFDFERDNSSTQAEAPRIVSYQASDRYLSVPGRLRSVWDVVSSALRLGIVELKTENDLSMIVKSLSRLNDRQLKILGFDNREDLILEVQDLIEVQEAVQREREAFEGRAMSSVNAALGHAA